MLKKERGKILKEKCHFKNEKKEKVGNKILLKKLKVIWSYFFFQDVHFVKNCHMYHVPFEAFGDDYKKIRKRLLQNGTKNLVFPLHFSAVGRFTYCCGIFLSHPTKQEKEIGGIAYKFV